MFRKRKVLGVLGVASALGLLPVPVAHASDPLYCAADRPCIDELIVTTEDAVYVHWRGQDDYDHYNFRWGRPGRAESQHQTRGGDWGQFTINNVWLDTWYTVKVQGCDTDFLGYSSCSPWEEQSILTY
ncbi:MAG: fibronectin type III domain-containing protein [Pseudonocardia sp.]|nr:MAG: fibronectin type III domain-containing protein [Pseudonocardia sp.]